MTLRAWRLTSLLCLGVTILGCQEYKLETKGNQMRRAEVVTSKDLVDLRVEVKDDGFIFVAKGPLSEVSYYPKVTTTREFSPIAQGIALPIAVLMMSPQAIENSLLGIKRGSFTDTSDPIIEIRPLGRTGEITTSAAGAAYSVRYSTETAPGFSVSEKGVLSSAASLPRQEIASVSQMIYDLNRKIPRQLAADITITYFQFGKSDQEPRAAPSVRFEVSNETLRDVAQGMVINKSDSTMLAAYTEAFNDGFAVLAELAINGGRATADYQRAIEQIKTEPTVAAEHRTALQQKIGGGFEKFLFERVVTRPEPAAAQEYKRFMVDQSPPPGVSARWTQVSALVDKAQEEKTRAQFQAAKRRLDGILQLAGKDEKMKRLKEYAAGSIPRELRDIAIREYWKLPAMVETRPFGSIRVLDIYATPNIDATVLQQAPAGRALATHGRDGDFLQVEYDWDKFGYIYKGFAE